MPASRALRQPEVKLRQLLEEGQVELELDETNADLDVDSVQTTLKYDGYLKRQAAEVERCRRSERRTIPSGFPFERVAGLSNEVVHRLRQIRPETLGQASRIPGMTPAAVAILSRYLDRMGGPESGGWSPKSLDASEASGVGSSESKTAAHERGRQSAEAEVTSPGSESGVVERSTQVVEGTGVSRDDQRVQ